MIRIKNKPTAVGFLAICTVIFLLVALLGMSMLFFYSNTNAIKDTARRMVSMEAVQASRHVTLSEEGKPCFEDSQQVRLANCEVVMLSESLEVMDGQYDEDVADVLKVEHVQGPPPSFQIIDTDHGKYYMADHTVRLIHTSNNYALLEEYGMNGLFLRAIMKAEDLNTVYQNTQKVFIAFLLFLIMLLILGGYVFYCRVTCPVREMCENVEQMQADPDYASCIEEDSRFYEMEVMTGAYNRLMERNRQLIQRQETFNENVSHELRTPIALIRSECELIEDMYLDDESVELAEAIDAIHKQSNRMNTMIAQMLHLARIDRENYSLRLERIDLRDIGESACEDAEDTVQGRYVFIYDWQPAEAMIDVTLVMIAVRNLISNAIKYSPAGSTIRVSTGLQDEMAFLQVKDEGMGIPEDLQEKVFEPYYQVKEERNSEGYGLGLALVTKIAEKHKGRVELESAAEVGSTFTVYFPVEQGGSPEIIEKV